MWVALPATRVALRVASVDRELGHVRLQGPEGTITVPAADAAKGILLIPVRNDLPKEPT